MSKSALADSSTFYGQSSELGSILFLSFQEPIWHTNECAIDIYSLKDIRSIAMIEVTEATASVKIRVHFEQS